jgi:hypothetical protein
MASHSKLLLAAALMFTGLAVDRINDLNFYYQLGGLILLISGGWLSVHGGVDSPHEPFNMKHLLLPLIFIIIGILIFLLFGG